MRMRPEFLIGFCGLLVTTAVSAGSKPVAVSPGDASKLVMIGDTCPTFSWGQVDRARSYELVVYRIGAADGEAQPVWQQELPGSALAWTPPLYRCLERGGQYAWSVRAVTRREASDWSPPSLFQVAAAPSAAEFEQAMQVVRSHLGAGDGARSTAGTDDLQAESEAAAGAEGSASSPVPRAVGTTQLSVDGGIEATSIIADGSGLTNVTADNGVPSGSVMFFNLNTCPAGWSLFADAAGRYLVGLNTGGTLGLRVGTALLDQEDRATGRHAHSVTDAGHSHQTTEFGHIHTITDPGHNHSINSGYYSTQPTVNTHSIEGVDELGSSNTTESPTGISVNSSTTGILVNSNTTGIIVDQTNTPVSTNAPYLQLLVCEKD